MVGKICRDMNGDNDKTPTFLQAVLVLLSAFETLQQTSQFNPMQSLSQLNSHQCHLPLQLHLKR